MDPTPFCQLPAHCPVCGQSNGCRMETGEAFKGACWCARIELSAEARERLSDEIPEPRCLCQACLEGLQQDPAVPWPALAGRSRARRS